MNLPLDVAKIAAFDEGHQSPHNTIKEVQTDLDLRNKIIREQILENRKDMKLAFDENVTPYSYSVGSVILLIDLVEKVGMSDNLCRHWVGSYRVSWLNSHSCWLVHTVTREVINNLVHINCIKPYFDRNELPDDPENLSGEVLERLGNAPMLGEATQTVAGEVRPNQTKSVKKRPGRLEPVTKSGPIVDLVEVLRQSSEYSVDIKEETD